MTSRVAPEPVVAVHPTLRVGAVNDPAEREADAVADRVMAMTESNRQPTPDASTVNAASSQATTLRRSCGCGCSNEPTEIRRTPGDEPEEEVQMKPAATPTGGVRVSAPVAAGISSARGSGAPLDTPVRSFFEPRMGTDLSAVRVHTDTRAADMATSIGARAFTVGHDVFFGRGEAQFGSTSGRHLLAHELTHTLQHRGRSETGRIRRWSIAADVATSDSTTDTLGGLATSVGAQFADWKCIRPLAMKTASRAVKPADFETRYERYVRAGDTFDISNLTATTGKKLRLYLFDDASEAKDAGIAQRFYPGAVSSLGPDGDIDAASVTGATSTPIHDFVVFGHAAGNMMFGGAGSFRPSDESPEDPRPYHALADIGLLPRRCWFTRSASARAVGCASNTFATDFAAAYLRTGSNVVATTASVRPHCIGLPNQISALLGDPTGCAWYNQLAFTASPAPGAALLDGPHSTVADFHASGFWTTIGGAL